MSTSTISPRSVKRNGTSGWRVMLSLLVPLVLLVAWELALRAGWLPATIIARPSQVLTSAENLTRSGELFKHAAVSLQRLTLGFVVGLVAAVGAGTLVGYSRLAERLLAPTIALVAPVPVTAWIPLLIIAVGVGEASKSSVIAIGTFFPVYFGTVNGIRSTSPKLIEVVRIYEKRPIKTLTHVLLPSALDSIFLGMRAALGLAWVLLIVAEVIASSNGIGWLMWDARNFARPADMIVGMITAGLLGAATTLLLARIQRRLLFWRPAFEGA